VYGVVAAANAYTGAPILMMIGGDDTLPMAKADAYLAYARGSGYLAPVELLSYADAKHGWTDPALGTAREYPHLASTRNCPFALITPNRGLELLLTARSVGLTTVLGKPAFAAASAMSWATTKRSVANPSMLRSPSSSKTSPLKPADW